MSGVVWKFPKGWFQSSVWLCVYVLVEEVCVYDVSDMFRTGSNDYDFFLKLCKVLTSQESQSFQTRQFSNFRWKCSIDMCQFCLCFLLGGGGDKCKCATQYKPHTHTHILSNKKKKPTRNLQGSHFPRFTIAIHGHKGIIFQWWCPITHVLTGQPITQSIFTQDLVIKTGHDISFHPQLISIGCLLFVGPCLLSPFIFQ